MGCWHLSVLTLHRKQLSAQVRCYSQSGDQWSASLIRVWRCTFQKMKWRHFCPFFKNFLLNKRCFVIRTFIEIRIPDFRLILRKVWIFLFLFPFTYMSHICHVKKQGEKNTRGCQGNGTWREESDSSSKVERQRRPLRWALAWRQDCITPDVA